MFGVIGLHVPLHLGCMFLRRSGHERLRAGWPKALLIFGATEFKRPRPPRPLSPSVPSHTSSPHTNKAWEQYVNVIEKHGYTQIECETTIHRAVLDKSWMTYYHGQFLHKISKPNAKGSVATVLNRLQDDMVKRGFKFEDLDAELKDKIATFTKFGFGSKTSRDAKTTTTATSSKS